MSKVLDGDLGIAQLTGIYRTVVLVTETDNRLRKGLQAGEFQCMYYPVRGQEIIPAAATAALEPSDYMVTTYRCLHDAIAKGAPLTEVIAEIMGRSTGTSKGKGGPMHLADPNSGLMATSGIVGSGLPIANGLGLASALKGDGRVSCVSFGDGATSIGAVHESFNLAALWSLPVIFLLQNNQYGEHTVMSGYTRTRRLSDRAAPYEMRGVTVDGNDPVAVFEAVREAAALARSGAGPTLIECLTYRLSSHSFGSSTAYMDPDELAQAWANDPVPIFRRRLIEEFGVSEADLEVLEAEARDEVEAAVQFAVQSPPPGPDELLTDVYGAPNGMQA